MGNCASSSGWTRSVGMGNCASSSGSHRDRDDANEPVCWYCRRRGRRCICPPVGSCCCPPGGAPLPSCVFYSPRIQGLLVGERTELETTKEHWTEVPRGSGEEEESKAQENRKYFDEVLVKHREWGAFFRGFEDLQVGAKIGEGGQAEIFKATSKTPFQDFLNMGLVAKVWKKGVSLKDLERQWPPQMLAKVAEGKDGVWPFKNILGGAFIRDGEFKNRFAFVMHRWWGDLRTYIDDDMLELLRNNSHGPLFRKFKDLCYLILLLSNDLHNMHRVGILHRDIKASNVLLGGPLFDSCSSPNMIDFECSLGVIGTGFWRTPEILEQLQKKDCTSELVLTEKADIYSFGMLCYEMITGRTPFEGHPGNDFRIVLRGRRPELPHDLDQELKQVVLDCWQQELKQVVLDCWQHDPELRPTASQIQDRLSTLYDNLRSSVLP